MSTAPRLAAAVGLPHGPLAALHRALDDLADGLSATELPATGFPRLDTLTGLFGLSAAARSILFLAAAAEVDGPIGHRLAALRGVPGPASADVATAVALAPDGSWEALSPGAPLRRWRLVDVVGNGPLQRYEITVDERIVHFLLAAGYVDPRLAGIVRIEPPAFVPSTAEAAIAGRLARAWRRTGDWPVLILTGPDPIGLRSAAAAGCHEAGLGRLGLNASHLPSDVAARHALAVLTDREMALAGAALIIDAHGAPDAAAAFAGELAGPVVLVGRAPRAPASRPWLRTEVPVLDRAGRVDAWHQALGPAAEALGPSLARLSEQFSLDRDAIHAAARQGLADAPVPPGDLFGCLWRAAREQGRRHLDGLAERIDARAGWDDLVLPREQHRQLHDLADHVRHAPRVRGAWGWEARGARGLGTSALFVGPSGTGKTLAAEVLATELDLDLYRIDLSQVVSKYIGETEKNLAQIFASAEDGGAILLFDEADALFGKRSDVKDSHDRYANIEVSYLLQRMETYRGLAVLTTNQRSALDSAFLRRLRTLVTFPFPDAPARTAMWRRVFPDSTPIEDLDAEQFGRLNIAGGSIRSIALNASYLAAADGGPVRRAHVLTAARREYAKLEKPMSAAEFGGLA